MNNRKAERRLKKAPSPELPEPLEHEVKSGKDGEWNKKLAECQEPE